VREELHDATELGRMSGESFEGTYKLW